MCRNYFFTHNSVSIRLLLLCNISGYSEFCQIQSVSTSFGFGLLGFVQARWYLTWQPHSDARRFRGGCIFEHWTFHLLPVFMLS